MDTIDGRFVKSWAIATHSIVLSTNETLKETYEKYMRNTKPIEYYVEKGLTTADATGNKSPPKDIAYNSYLFFCHEKKIPPESEYVFSRKLKKEFGFQDVQFNKKDGKKIWCWMDVRIVDWKAVEDSEQQTLPAYTETREGGI